MRLAMIQASVHILYINIVTEVLHSAWAAEL